MIFILSKAYFNRKKNELNHKKIDWNGYYDTVSSLLKQQNSLSYKVRNGIQVPVNKTSKEDERKLSP